MELTREVEEWILQASREIQAERKKKLSSQLLAIVIAMVAGGNYGMLTLFDKDGEVTFGSEHDNFDTAKLEIVIYSGRFLELETAFLGAALGCGFEKGMEVSLYEEDGLTHVYRAELQPQHIFRLFFLTSGYFSSGLDFLMTHIEEDTFYEEIVKPHELKLLKHFLSN